MVEFTDQRKANHSYLSITGGVLSCANTTEDKKRIDLRLYANNNASKLSFGCLSKLINKRKILI